MVPVIFSCSFSNSFHSGPVKDFFQNGCKIKYSLDYLNHCYADFSLFDLATTCKSSRIYFSIFVEIGTVGVIDRFKTIFLKKYYHLTNFAL